MAGSQGHITAVCTVLFDLDQGQIVEFLYPPNALTEEEQRRVAFHALPDSTTRAQQAATVVRDSSYFFSFPTPGRSPPRLHGYTFCRQRVDEALPRGAEQRSVVLLSTLPLHALWMPLACQAGPLCLSYGELGVQEVFESAAALPLTSTASSGECRVWLAGREVTVQLPDPVVLDGAPAYATLDPSMGLPACLLTEGLQLTPGPYSGLDTFTVLSPVLQRLWALWELVVLGKPLAVIGPTPGACSEGVAALLILAEPLAYANDARPYLTIQDPAFMQMIAPGGAGGRGALPGRDQGTSGTPSVSGIDNPVLDTASRASLPRLVGITNLYFLKALPDWPNVISLGWSDPRANTGGGLASADATTSSSGAAPSRLRQRAVGAAAALAGRVAGWVGTKPSPAAALLGGRGPSDGAWLRSPTRAAVQHDVLSSLAAVPPPNLVTAPTKAARAAAHNSLLLRRHFQELTRALLVPLLPYITPGAVSGGGGGRSPGGTSPLTPQSSPPPLDPGAVLDGLQSPGGTLPEPLARVFGSRARVVEFYEEFLRSDNCQRWVTQRQADLRTWQEQREREGAEKNA